MKTDAHQPIGVFDSGVGGLTVLKHLVQAMPDEQFVYLGIPLEFHMVISLSKQ